MDCNSSHSRLSWNAQVFTVASWVHLHEWEGGWNLGPLLVCNCGGGSTTCSLGECLWATDRLAWGGGDQGRARILAFNHGKPSSICRLRTSSKNMPSKTSIMCPWLKWTHLRWTSRWPEGVSIFFWFGRHWAAHLVKFLLHAGTAVKLICC